MLNYFASKTTALPSAKSPAKCEPCIILGTPLYVFCVGVSFIYDLLVCCCVAVSSISLPALQRHFFLEFAPKFSWHFCKSFHTAGVVILSMNFSSTSSASSCVVYDTLQDVATFFGMFLQKCLSKIIRNNAEMEGVAVIKEIIRN